MRRESSLDARWERLYMEFRPVLYRAAALMVGDGEAEELVQDAFERAMRQQRFFDEVREPRAWLRTALARLAISRLRRRSVWERIRPPHAPEISDPDPGCLDLRRALLALSAPQRAAIVLHHYHGAGYGEVAEALGLEPSSIGKLLTRARRALRDELRQETDGRS
ncbi:MAG: RNA polymerase sigma factor [Candidatus Limnocylindria bacterium]